MALKRSVWIWVGVGLLSIALAPGMPYAQGEEAAESRPNIPPPPPPPVTELVRIEHAPLEDVLELRSLLSDQGIRMEALDDSRIIAVSGPSREDVARVQEFVAQLDVPPPSPKNIEVTIHLLRASKADKGHVAPQDSASDEDISGEAIAASGVMPDQLEAVAVELAKAFEYDTMEHIETLSLRAREGSACETTGVLPGQDDMPEAFYAFKCANVAVGGTEERPVVSLSFQLVAQVPYRSMVYVAGKEQRTTSWRDVGLETEIDIREKQKVVVGKARLDKSGAALFVVVTAEVVQ